MNISQLILTLIPLALLAFCAWMSGDRMRSDELPDYSIA